MCRIEAITFLKQLQRLLYVVWLLGQSLRIPLAAWHTEEVAAIDVNRPGQSPDRIGDRMDDVVAQGKGVAFAQCLGASGLDTVPRLARQSSPEDVVFTA